MCGNHAADGSPIDHHHDHHHGHHGQAGDRVASRVFRPRAPHRSRRAFLGDIGKGTLAMAVFTPTLLAACSSSDGDVAQEGSGDASDPAPTTAAAADPTQPPPQPTTEPAAPATAAPATEGQADEPVRWARANLGFVSAYVLARGNTAAIVDTGNPGSAAAIGESLATLGLNYSDVAHVILTHNHPDHAGSISEVLGEAINAKSYAGEADLGSLASFGIDGVVGGEDIFGFEMIATPGHTAGHMCVIDHQAGLLLAGDAIFGENGGVVEGPERFFSDVAESQESIRTLAQLSFNTVLFGHGEPIEANADTAVADLAASFG